MADSPSADLTRAARLLATFGDAIHERLLRRYRDVDPDAVADATMEAILAASADPAFPSDGDFPRKLAEHARQRLRVRLRGSTRRRKREEKYAAAVTDRHSAAPTPADDAETRELAALLRDRIARTPQELAVFDLWSIDVTEPVEVAGRLGMSPAEAKTILDRLRQRIYRERTRQEDDP